MPIHLLLSTFFLLYFWWYYATSKLNQSVLSTNRTNCPVIDQSQFLQFTSSRPSGRNSDHVKNLLSLILDSFFIRSLQINLRILSTYCSVNLIKKFCSKRTWFFLIFFEKNKNLAKFWSINGRFGPISENAFWSITGQFFNLSRN